MKNNSSQGKVRKITAKVLVVLLAVVMAVSVLPALSADIFPATNAAVELDVNNPDLGYVNGQLASYPAGTVVNLNLYTDINFTNVEADIYGDGFTGIIIPAGITVNLYMSGNSIIFSRTSGGAYKLPYVYGIHNKGTLNVYAGGARGNSIIIENIRTGEKCDVDEGTVYFNLEGIRNEGNLTVNEGVNISINATYEFSETGNGKQEQIAIGATAIYNIGNASCEVIAAKLSATTRGISVYDADRKWSVDVTNYVPDSDPCNDTAVSYGIYGGNVSVSRGANINVSAFTQSSRNTGDSSKYCGESKVTGIAYGIATDKSVSVTGGNISVATTTNSYNATSSERKTGSLNLYAGGIYYVGSNVPYMPDATISVSQGAVSTDTHNGETRFRNGTVVTSTSLPKAATTIVSDNHNYNGGYTAWPSAEVSGGSFCDEVGNLYATVVATKENTAPTSIVRGALAGKTRVHIVYRYWIDDSLQKLDTSVVDANGNKGFTYAPRNNTPEVVKTDVSFSGISGGLVANNGSKIAYTSGGEAYNDNYWDFRRITYQVAGKETFSEYDVIKPGTELIDFQDETTLNNSMDANGGSVFLFLDYIRKPVSYVKASVGTGKIVSTVYTGTNILASDIGLEIRDSFIERDYTSEYNIDFNNDNLIPVTFTYTGKNVAGVEEVGTDGKLPVNAGVYEVTLHIDDSTEYNSDPKISKNRKGIEFTFQLTVEQAPVERGNLLREVNLLYGQKLGEVVDFSKYAPEFLGSDSGISGTYSFENSADGTTCKDVGSGIVNVVWTPAYAENATVKNYAPTTFELRYVIGKGVIEIYPNGASIVYGDEADGQLFSSTIKGIADNDSADYVRKILADRISYSVVVNGTETAYTPGNIPAGEYVISAKVDHSNLTGSLENYSFVCKQGADNPQGVLKVEQRGLKLQAAAEERGYDPDNNEITVAFNIVSGKFGNDEVSVTSVIATVADNTVGQHEFTLAEIGELTGEKAANYRIDSVTSSSPDGKYYVYITKGQPDVAVPVIAEMFYRQDRTLDSINLNTTTPAVEGEWKWVDPDIRPTVNVTYYKAQFIPKDTSIYDIKIADVKINVKPTPVVISYQETVEYGDRIPNITGYTYTAAQDPSFSIDEVKTTGNIVPVTDYQKGSPVKNGGYAVRITANDYADVNGNYSFSVKDGVITVVPKVITYTVENREIVYGDSFDTNSVKLTFDKNLLVGSDTESSLTADGRIPAFVIISDFNNQSDAGEYTLNANCTTTPSANYTIEVKPGQLNVKQAPLTIKGNDISLEYGSAVPADINNAFTVSGIKKGEVFGDIFSGVISVSTEYKKGSSVKAEGYPVEVNVDGAFFKNYTVTTQDGLITVYKATPVIYHLPSATILHGQTLADAVFSGASTSVSGSFAYEFPTVAPDYKEGVYDYFKADFVPEDTTNYNVVSGNIVKLTVTKTEVSGILAVTGVPMAGETLIVDGTGLVPAENIYTFTWYDENDAVLGTGAEFTLDENCVGKKIYVTAAPDASSVYTGSVSSASIAVTKDLEDIRNILTSSDYSTYFETTAVFGGTKEVVYNGEAQGITFTGKTEAVGTVSVRYNGSADVPVDAGTYTVTVDIAAGAEYSPISNFTIGILRISPKNCTIIVNAADKVYDGTRNAEATLSKDIEVIGDDDVQFDATAVTYQFDSADAGKGKLVSAVYTSCLKGEDAKNYKGQIVVENNGSAVIEKMSLVIEISAVSREYQDKNFDVDLEFSFTPVAGDEELVYVNRAKSKGTIVGNRNGVDNGVGQHEVNISGVELAGSKAENYTVSYNKTATVEIVPATPSYSVPSVGGELYYDSTRTLKDISLGNESWSWAEPDVVPQAGAHTYKAVYNPTDANYATVEYDIPVEIHKAVVIITAESFSVTYGDIAPTYRYTVKGLTGTDTIEENSDGYVLISCGYSSGSDVDTYPIKLVGTLSSDNYEFSFVNGTLTVSQRVAYIEVEAENRPYADGNTEVTVNFTGISNLFGNDADNIKLFKDSVTGTIDSDKAGTQTVKFAIPALVGDKAKNYTVSPRPAELTVEITKAAVPGVVLPSTGEVYFGFNLRSVIFTSGSLDTELGSFSMENPSATADKIGTFTNVYKVVFTPKDSENFATVSDYITINVLPANISAAFYLDGEFKSGKTLEINLRNAPADALNYLDFVWYRVDGPEDAPETGTVVATGTRTYTLTDDDSGKYIICSVTNKENSPYICNSMCVSDSEIEARQLTFWEKFINWFYGLISNFTQLFSGLFG